MTFKTRTKHPSPVWKTLLFCVMFALLGAAAGALSKYWDISSEVLGNLTSGMCVWIFICTSICAFTKSPFRSAAYVLLFCAAMIAAYYLTAVLGELYYSRSFVTGWSVFALFTPLFAFFAWFARGGGRRAWVLRIGIAVVMICSAFLLSGGLALDCVCIAAAFAVTMIKEKEAEQNKH